MIGIQNGGNVENEIKPSKETTRFRVDQKIGPAPTGFEKTALLNEQTDGPNQDRPSKKRKRNGRTSIDIITSWWNIPING